MSCCGVNKSKMELRVRECKQEREHAMIMEIINFRREHKNRGSVVEKRKEKQKKARQRGEKKTVCVRACDCVCVCLRLCVCVSCVLCCVCVVCLCLQGGEEIAKTQCAKMLGVI